MKTLAWLCFVPSLTDLEDAEVELLDFELVLVFWKL